MKIPCSEWACALEDLMRETPFAQAAQNIRQDVFALSGIIKLPDLDEPVLDERGKVHNVARGLVFIRAALNENRTLARQLPQGSDAKCHFAFLHLSCRELMAAMLQVHLFPRAEVGQR